MKTFLLGISGLILLSSPSRQDGKLSDTISLDVEVGSIQHAVDELGRVSHVPMKVVGPALKDTIYLHVQGRPVQEVLDHLAIAVEGQWKLSTDGTYILSRNYAKIESEEKSQQTETLAKLEKWRSVIMAGLNQPYDPASLNKLMTEYRVITAHDGDEDENRPPENASVEKRREYFEHCNPMARAIARAVAKINLAKILTIDQSGPLTYSVNANSSQLPLPTGGIEAMAKIRNEYNSWIQQLAKHPAPKRKTKDGEESDDYSDWLKPKPDETAKDREQRNDAIARQSPWERLQPLTEGPTNAVVTFERSFGQSLVCNLSLYGQSGNLLASSVSYMNSTSDTFFEQKKKMNINVEPSHEVVALWSYYNQTEEYSESKPTPDSIKAMEPYFNDPINHDALRIGNQELLDAIAKSKGKSIVACLPDGSLASYQKEFSTDKFLAEDPQLETRHQESDQWVDIYPASRREHWQRRLDRQSMEAFSKEYRSSGKVDMSTYLPLECGEFGYPSESDLCEFIKEMFQHHEWFQTPYRSSFNHLFLSLTPEQWARIQHGETIPYRELSETQLQLISRIVYGEFDSGYIGGEPPNALAKNDPTFELSNGLLGGGGLGGEIVYDDVLIPHSMPRKPNDEENDRNGINISERKEKYKKLPSMCGVGYFIPQSSLFEFRTQKRYSLKVHLSASHYYVGDFMEPIPIHNGERLYRYDELSSAMIAKISAHQQIMDDSNFRKADPPPQK